MKKLGLSHNPLLSRPQYQQFPFHPHQRQRHKTFRAMILNGKIDFNRAVFIEHCKLFYKNRLALWQKQILRKEETK